MPSAAVWGQVLLLVLLLLAVFAATRVLRFDLCLDARGRPLPQPARWIDIHSGDVVEVRCRGRRATARAHDRTWRVRAVAPNRLHATDGQGRKKKGWLTVDGRRVAWSDGGAWARVGVP